MVSAIGAALTTRWYHAEPWRANTDVSHSYTNNHAHVVYSTANREDLIPPEFEKRLYSFVAEIGREHKIPLLAAGGMPNHSHLLFLLPPTIKLADAVNKFKANSSRFLNKQGIEFNWQKGYGAFAVSASQIETVRAYIRNQREHHKKRSFEQEFLAMLKKARVPYDPKYVFGECRTSGARLFCSRRPSPSGTGLTFGQPGLRPSHYRGSSIAV